MIKTKKKTIGIIPNRKKSKKNKEDEVAGASNSELKEESEDKQDKQTHELQFFNYEELTTEEATRIFNILKPSFPAKDAENQNKNETATEIKTEAEIEDEDENDTEGKLGDPEVKEFVKDFIRGADPKVIILNLPLVASSPTTVIMRHEAVVRKVIAGGHDATKGDMEAVAAGGVMEILGKGGG